VSFSGYSSCARNFDDHSVKNTPDSAGVSHIDAGTGRAFTATGQLYKVVMRGIPCRWLGRLGEVFFN
jgi:hypothetical protein